jgi:hypothetical protein
MGGNGHINNHEEENTNPTNVGENLDTFSKILLFFFLFFNNLIQQTLFKKI